jgi:hypothetical protein
MTQVVNPFFSFFDLDGNPLEGGQIYIGQANLDPRTNPIQVYFDEDRTITAAQPIGTVSGLPAYQGAPKNMFIAEANYSILVLNKFGTPIVSSPDGIVVLTGGELDGQNGSDNVGFIQSGASADPETVQTALRREVWADQYKLAADADDKACIERAVTALLAADGGGIVRLSRRTYTLNSGITFTNLNNIRIVGAGRSNQGTLIRENFTSGDCFAFRNCQSSEISDVKFWPVVRKTSGFSVVLDNGCFDMRVNIRSDYGWNGLLINGATETRYRIITRYMLGTNGVKFAGSLSTQSYRCIAEDHIGDNPFPSTVNATSANAKTFSASMALANGDHFIANNTIWQCVVAGTAGASAPSGYPAGTSPESVFETNITNGTAQVRFVSNSAFTHLVQDNYAYSLVIGYAALLNGARGFAMEDAANTGTSYPVWAFIVNLECDNNYLSGVDLLRGEGFYGSGIQWIGSCKTGSGVIINPTFRGDVVFGEGTRIMGNAEHGVLRQAGPVSVRFDGAECTDNSAESAGSFHGLQIAASSVDTQVNGGRFGDSPSVAGNNQGFGISIGNSTTNTSIIGANVRGNTTSAISIGTSQTNLLIKDCPGYNASASAAITVGASPFAFANTTGADALVSVTGGTVSDISMDGVTLATASPRQVVVPAGATLTVTYTVAPTMARRLL